MSKIHFSALAALCLSAAAPAQEPPVPTLDHLLAHVAAGHDLRQSEFRAVISDDGARRLLRAADCEAGPPRHNQQGSSAMIMWDCGGREDRSSAGAMVDLDGERITRVEVMSAVIVQTRSE